MKNNLIRKSSILAVLISLFMVTLTACSSKATVEESKDSGTVTAEETVVKEEVTVEAAEPEPTEEAAPEPTEEPMPEPTEEPMPEIVYEGIDYESTLPAGEWAGTFLGIIEEPKFIVTNDSTNKKLIVEEGQKVILGEGDSLGVYTSGGIVVGYSGLHYTDTESFGNVYEKVEIDAVTEETVFEAKVSTTEGKKFISCILVPNN